MGDMLIRGIDPDLKRRVEESAQRNSRSLSEEAIVLMQRGIVIERAERQRAGDRLLTLTQGASFTDDEMNSLRASRSEADRAPPDFSERK